MRTFHTLIPLAVALPHTPSAAPVPLAPSLWELGIELAADTRCTVQLAERLHCGEDADQAPASSDLEEALAAEGSHREALHRKHDASCWVIERLRAEAACQVPDSTPSVAGLIRQERHRRWIQEVLAKATRG